MSSEGMSEYVRVSPNEAAIFWYLSRRPCLSHNEREQIYSMLGPEAMRLADKLKEDRDEQ